MKGYAIVVVLLISIFVSSCGKKEADSPVTPTVPVDFNISSSSINNTAAQPINYNVTVTPTIKFSFPTTINRNSVTGSVSLKDASGATVSYNTSYEKTDSVMVISPAQPLNYLSRYNISVTTQLKSASGGNLTAPVQINFQTAIDSSNKFPVISDDSLLTLVQKQTFKYFWDFGHPESGLSRERNSSGDLVTSGGSGFGIMAIVTGVHRKFITRAEAVTRMQKIVSFLKNKADKFHGAFPHWLNGATGVVIPFSAKDNGADLVETSYLMQGLLTARQYFNDAGAAETGLRNDITALYNAVEWNFFRKNNEQVLYWHWSPNYNWDMNHKIQGWNECLVTYVLAASSPTFSVPKTVYDNGWALSGGMKNNNFYYGLQLPLGPDHGGPLFFAHYSFLGINPINLADAYANYWNQNKNHALINYNYVVSNPKGYYGYSNLSWGLTASDIAGGYTASSPTNDVGVIAPTAAVSSIPYTPIESMQALKFFYYVLGDKLWGEYGFRDAFSLKDIWFADSYLAIDQGPMIIMIENYRSGLLWNLFTSCPEVKAGMKSLGFTAPYL